MRKEKMMLKAERLPNGKGTMSLAGDLDFIVESFGIFVAKTLHMSDSRCNRMKEDDFIGFAAPALLRMFYNDIDMFMDSLGGGENG